MPNGKVLEDKKQPTWIERERKRVEQERQAKLQEMGFEHTPLTLEQGETMILIKNPEKEPREITGKWGQQRVFTVQIKGEIFDWAVSLNSPLYRELLDVLAKGINPITIIRAGREKQTRYSIKEA